jgi:hypothetical protein
MRIPTGNFGQVVPVVRPGAAAFDNTQVSQAAERLGRTGQAIANDVAQQQIQQNDALSRVRASNLLLDRETQIKTITQDLGEKARTGALTHDQLPVAYEQAVSKLEPITPKGLGPVEMETFGASLKRLQIGGTQDLQPIIQKARIGEAQSEMANRLDLLGKDAGMPGTDPGKIAARLDSEDVDTSGRMAFGLDWDHKKQDFKDSIFATNAIQRAGAAKNDMGQLKQLEHDLTAEDGFYTGKLDASRRTTVLNQVQNFQIQLENRALAAEAKREAGAQRAIYSANQQLASGIPAPAGFWDGVGAKVKGTSAEGDFKDLVQGENEIQSVLRLPANEQVSFVQKRQQDLQQNGGTVKDLANLNRLNTAVTNNVKQMQDQPLVWAGNRLGNPPQPLDLASLVNGGDTSAITNQLQDRATTITGMRNMYGSTVKMAPLLPQEATALSGALQQATPRQQGQIFGILKNAFGDDAAYQGAMQQIAPDSPVRAMAGMIYSKQKDITLQSKWFGDNVMANSGDVAATMLTGENILNKTKADKGTDGKSSGFPIPKEQDFRTTFSSVVGNVFANRPEAFDIAMQSVRSYYTGKAAQDGDVSGEIDTKRMKQAITATIGRPVSVGGGSPVLAPWGMDEDTFHSKAKTSFEAEMTKHGMPAALTNNFGVFGLENRTGDTYRVVQGGDYLRDKSGQPIIINVKGDGQ